ncbi:MAG: DEAD/DEAH box helicase [Cyanobacteria bacterium P01_F01_bin.86]
MASDLLAEQQALYQKYLQLENVQRSLVQVFAVLYQPIGRSRALKVWNAVFPPRGIGVKISQSNQFNFHIRELINDGLLTQEPNEGARCVGLLVDIGVRDAIKAGTFDSIAHTIAEQFPVRTRYYGYGPLVFSQESEFLRELRLAFYRQDAATIVSLNEDFHKTFWSSKFRLPKFFQAILNNPFDQEWFDSLAQGFQQYVLKNILDDSVRRCVPANQAFELLESLYDAVPQTSPELGLLYAEQLWLRGYLEDASKVLDAIDNSSQTGQLEILQGALAFLNGHTEVSLTHYRSSLKTAGKSQSTIATWFQNPAAILYFFALLKDGSPAAYRAAENYATLLQKQSAHWLGNAMPLFLHLLQNQQGRFDPVATSQFTGYTVKQVGLVTLLEIYSLYWLGVQDLEQWLPSQLPRLYRAASQADYSWIALATVELMACFSYEELPEGFHTELATALCEEIGGQPLIDTVKRQEPWEVSLGALTNLAGPVDTKGTTAVNTPFRLIWKLRFSSLANWELTPIEQKRSTRGGWTKGKVLSLKRLHSVSSRPDYLTPEDEQLCDTIKTQRDTQRYYYGKATYEFNDYALLALVGHPHVFWADTENIRVEVVKGEPELLVKRLSSDRLRLELFPEVHKDSPILAFKETPTRLKVIEVNDDHLRIAQLLGSNHRLEVPAEAQDRVLQAIASVASLITVQSDIGGGVEATEVPSDSTPRMHLLPAGDGLKAALLIHPFPEGGSYYAPGKGGATVIAEVGGQRWQTQRDLKEEKKRAKEVKTACEVLRTYKAKKGEWLIEDPADCLELLLQLQTLGDRVLIEWPEGEKFRVSRQLGLADFNFNIRRQKDWFAASGEVRISEDHVLDMQQLMVLLEGSPGKFIQLSDGQFLALTEEFRQRLQALNRLAEPNGTELRVHGLAALALDEMVEDVEQLKVDKAWKTHLKRIKTARSIEPQLPAELQANLRDYQREGYTWLARLAHWGVGACLADDMGLGKTLQAIAIILSRSSGGPSLVIAPTSVGLNWLSEIERFAPSLQVKVLGSGDRQKLLASLGPNDLLICSYGLLQQKEVATMLAKIVWQTIVLDEAQAIKNTATKRSQAAMSLQGNFKVITTGTPIENHLGELWNLFRFINPGLLGSLDSFNQRFAYPIERENNEAAREALRRLIQPFILRRTKDQVLQELPSRTEITLQVELSAEEMAFYEALRREAVEKLNNSEAEAGTKHLQVLAEIMRLRRACCNPQLVRSDLGLASTKLQQFGAVLEELLENNHKALVFSQFVDHLAILREYLNKQQIAYQYLDGSTPAKQRKARVDAFQQGEGDVFLISLKAGGTGLNLTAADYVIHMDPWWNPAVEDQASDRAHRIGQQRPVTIYRLVAKGTIEDKIVALHQTKRDLADSLLAGSDVSGKISTNELLSLIQTS